MDYKLLDAVLLRIDVEFKKTSRPLFMDGRESVQFMSALRDAVRYNYLEQSAGGEIDGGGVVIFGFTDLGRKRLSQIKES